MSDWTKIEINLGHFQDQISVQWRQKLMKSDLKGVCVANLTLVRTKYGSPGLYTVKMDGQKDISINPVKLHDPGFVPLGQSNQL